MLKPSSFVPVVAIALGLVTQPGAASAQIKDEAQTQSKEAQIEIKIDQAALKAQIRAAVDDLKIDGAQLKADIEAGMANLGDALDLTSAAKSAALFAQNPRPPQPPRPPRPEVVIRGDNNEDRAYQSGVRSLDNAQWEQAIRSFNNVIALNGSRADGATYWIAWAQYKQGNGAAALESLTRLRQTYASSRWIPEARALEVEVRQAAGQAVKPESVPDDELKLVALNSLVKADEQRAIPLIEKILQGPGSPRLKERALFVLAQNQSTQARQIVARIAKGDGNPDLQAKAVSYLGVIGGSDTKQTLLEIYKGSSNLSVKRSILRAFMASGDRDRLLDIAKTEQVAELRAEAVQQLGAMGAQEELAQLYRTDTSIEVRKRIIQAMFAGHNETRLIQLLRAETDPDLRRSIVQNLGMIASPSSTDALVSVYASDKDEAIKRTVIDALFTQRNVKALIEMARKETDPGLKRRMVERLSSMKSPEATDYFLELLSKP